MLAKKLSGATAAAAADVYVEDVFSTYLYTGNNTSQTITNGIDLSGEGGMVWTKSRSSSTWHPVLIDTLRGTDSQGYLRLFSTLTLAATGSNNGLTAFNSNGYSIGASGDFNNGGDTFVSWTFRRAEKFFDVVTYTGNGATGRAVSHNLGSVPGCIIVKRTDSGGTSWAVYHRTQGASSYGVLNLTQSFASGGNGYWYATPTSSVFYVSDFWGDGWVNGNGATYVAYLFAHDAGGFGDNSDQSVIKCGSANFSTTANIDLGWEPQWLMFKRSDDASDWRIVDNMRGWPVSGNPQELNANRTYAEASNGGVNITNTGFSQVISSGTWIYIAIRRGPMKTPESGTEVFDVDTYTGNNGVDRLISSGFAADFALITDRADSSYAQRFVADRLRGGGNSMSTTTTYPEGGDTGYLAGDMATQFQSNEGILVTITNSRFNSSGRSYVAYQMRRAPGFMDVVAYTGNGTPGRTVSHNLGVAPEMMIVKGRTGTGRWATYVAPLGATHRILVELTIAAQADSSYWDNTTPTSSIFTVGGSIYTNGSGTPYVAYLFASLPGISKVGSVTITGSAINVDCGFTSGARFVLMKNTSATGPWLLWDSARGIVAGNDPYIFLHSQTVENVDGAADFIDPYSAGFTIAAGAIDGYWGAGDYIYLAIA